MNVKISYTKKVDKFLENNPNLITEEELDELLISAVKKIFKIENANVDLKMLKGSRTGYFRIRKGDIRIVFSLVKSEILQIIVNDIGFRGNIYK